MVCCMPLMHLLHSRAGSWLLLVAHAAEHAPLGSSGGGSAVAALKSSACLQTCLSLAVLLLLLHCQVLVLLVLVLAAA